MPESFILLVKALFGNFILAIGRLFTQANWSSCSDLLTASIRCEFVGSRYLNLSGVESGRCKNDFSSCDVISEFAESSQATKWLKREMVGHLTRWELKRRKRKNIFFFLSLSLQMAINLRNNERCCTIHWQYFNQKRNSRNRLFFSISISRAFASENRKVWIETKFISGQMQKKFDRIMAFQTLPL